MWEREYTTVLSLGKYIISSGTFCVLNLYLRNQVVPEQIPRMSPVNSRIGMPPTSNVEEVSSGGLTNRNIL